MWTLTISVPFDEVILVKLSSITGLLSLKLFPQQITNNVIKGEMSQSHTEGKGLKVWSGMRDKGKKKDNN